VKSLPNTKWNNATNAQCWQRLTNLGIYAVKVTKSYCGFVVVAVESQD